jgi:phosphomannomutase
VFIPIDSENVTAKDEEYFDSLAKEYPDAFAIVSTDGDSDRPFVIDEHGIFHRGDVLGAVVAEWLQADFAAFPVSASDATDKSLSAAGIGWKHTKIGSPHVIACMKDALATGSSRVVGWEVNGGFLLGSDLDVRGKRLGALPTRDAFVAIVIAMLAASEKQLKVSELFAALPQRFSQAGLMNDFPQAVSQKMIQRFDHDTLSTRQALEPYFAKKDGFSAISSLNTLDGIRILFENGEVAHLRPSGNAPQLRVYSVADSQGRADEIVAAALAEPNGIFRTMQREISVGIHLHKAS